VSGPPGRPTGLCCRSSFVVECPLFGAGGHLLLKAIRFVTTALVSFHVRKGWQPRLATDGPAFVGWLKLIGSIKGSQVHFDFVRTASENRRAAVRAKKTPSVISRFTANNYRILREHCGSIKKSPVMLAAVETVTKADPVWASRRYNLNFAANAAARETVHDASPPSSSIRKSYNDFSCASTFRRPDADVRRKAIIGRLGLRAVI
jgi:hypothetical protein